MKDLGCQAAQGGGTDRAHKGAQKAVALSILAWPQPIVTTISSGDLPNLGQISPDALLRACCRQFDHSLGALFSMKSIIMDFKRSHGIAAWSFCCVTVSK